VLKLTSHFYFLLRTTLQNVIQQQYAHYADMQKMVGLLK